MGQKSLAVRQLDIYSSPAGNLSVGKLIDTIGKRADFRSTALNYKSNYTGAPINSTTKSGQ